ncbi:5-oxoprolinase subunit PxpB [Mesorhizobium opportunistum]|uniref:Allophanate hydrolase subunit 1 n=1 Tax=Mesorhizobium opportunistum (strain LMG 24607 / HAMBI 3007 / WSM2075) TaxID=536019 RepID=F7Y4F4_MESOW|nr:5-oxoprolinase subunit PxpB [Mesorhizobium opportunistum]AEH87274.1 Allophanate hydrolase subunit 1 [Mesorhizobium opportunistum WSM2075]
MVVGTPHISLAGSAALLLDGAQGAFDDATQELVWAVANAALSLEGVRETVPGMNNLLVVFDPLATDAHSVGDQLMSLWTSTDAHAVAGTNHTIPVSYGGSRGEDLAGWAAHCGLSVDETVRRHAAAAYTVAAIGAMPGFPYLSGLDPRLAWARRSTPRLKVTEGAVIIGGAQAGVMPMTAPSGWHMIGHTDVKLFNAEAELPVLLWPGDTIRFEIAGIEA